MMTPTRHIISTIRRVHWSSSTNELRINKRRIIRDCVFLQQAKNSPAEPLQRTLKDRLEPYTCYATLFLCGPLVQSIVNTLSSIGPHDSVYQEVAPSLLSWTCTRDERACVVRVAGVGAETVRLWLRTSLGELRGIIGDELYERAL